MLVKKHNNLLLICLVGLLALIDIISQYKKFIQVKAENLNSLHIIDRQSALEEITTKLNPSHQNHATFATNYLMDSIKATLLPPSTTYIRKPVSNILYKLIISCSKLLPYREIANFITYLSILTAIPIFFLIKSSQPNHQKLACIFFQIKR
jgi:hypothetical protein